MHATQAKTYNPVSAVKTPEATQKAAHSAAASTRLPAWTHAWRDQPLASLQAKLTVNQPNDPYEQEADRVAEQVMRMPDSSVSVQRKCACGGTSGPSGECAECANKRLALQRRSASHAEPSTAPSVVHEALRSSDQSLDASTKAFMEPRLGYDLSHVRVHTNEKAAESARAVNALAYTVGQDVVFGAGQYAPGSREGQRLLAHELVHTIQQSSSSAILQRTTIKSATFPVTFPPAIPTRGPNPASCMLPLCKAIPLNDANPQQRADEWRTASLACLRAGASASNASHADDIVANTEQELQGEVDELNQWFNGLPSAQRAGQQGEYLARLGSICRRKQREAEIEFHFNVIFERPPGEPKWGTRPGEWDDINTVLEALPIEATWANPTFLHFRREACHPRDVNPNTGACTGQAGGFIGGDTNAGTGVIRIFSEGLGQQPYSRSASLGLSATSQTLRHEVGHVIDRQIPQAEMTNFFENIMHWQDYSWVWITQFPSPYHNWQQERDRLRAELGFNDAQLDAWLRGLVVGMPVVQGSRTYARQPSFLTSYDASQMPTGREFEYARTGRGEYFAELYAFAVSSPEFLHAKLPSAQIAWFKRVVFHTQEHFDRVTREAAIAGPTLNEFLTRASRLFTLKQLQDLLQELMVRPRPLSTPTGSVQTKLAVNQPGDAYEQEADRVAEQVMRMPASGTSVVQAGVRHAPIAVQRQGGGPTPTTAAPRISMQDFIDIVKRVEADNPGKSALEIEQLIARTKFHSDAWDWLLPSLKSTSGPQVTTGGSVTGSDVALLSRKLIVTLPGGGEADPLHIVVGLVAQVEKQTPGAGGAGGWKRWLVQSLPSGVSQGDVVTWLGDVGQAAAEWMSAHPHPRGGTTMQSYMDEYAPQSDLIGDVDSVAMSSTSGAFVFDPSKPLSDNLQRFYFPSAPREGRLRRFHIFCAVRGFALEPDGVTLSSSAITTINTRVQAFEDWFSKNNPSISAWVRQNGYSDLTPSYNPVWKLWTSRANDWQWFAQQFRDFVQNNLRAEGP